MKLCWKVIGGTPESCVRGPLTSTKFSEPWVVLFCKQSYWKSWLSQFISSLSSSYAQYSHVKTLVPDLEELEFVCTSSINEVCWLQPTQDLN